VLRHDFQPGKLVAGAFLTAAAVVFGGDAAGMWSTPWYAMVPMVIGGLCLAGATGTVTRAVRYRRARPPGGGGQTPGP
jgi:hypothetical protein